MDSLRLYNFIKKIKKSSKSEHLKEIANCSFSDLYKYHFSYGMWLRNHCLYNNSEIVNFFNNIGITDIDEVSMLLMELLYIDLKYESKID